MTDFLLLRTLKKSILIKLTKGALIEYIHMINPDVYNP